MKRTTFAPNGIQTRETCPACGKAADVEHGHAAILESDGATADPNAPWHFWHCSGCGDSLVLVVHECQDCEPRDGECGACGEIPCICNEDAYKLANDVL